MARIENDVEIALDDAPVGDHQASGLVENTVKNVQGQFRMIEDALESRCERRVREDRQVVPWMVMHTALVINRGKKDEE